MKKVRNVFLRLSHNCIAPILDIIGFFLIILLFTIFLFLLSNLLILLYVFIAICIIREIIMIIYGKIRKIRLRKHQN